jgi:hypothetical protein
MDTDSFLPLAVDLNNQASIDKSIQQTLTHSAALMLLLTTRVTE